MGNNQTAQRNKQAKEDAKNTEKFSSIVSDQVCAFIVNPFPNLAGLEGKNITFGTDEYAEYVKNCIESCRANVDGKYSLCSEEPAYKNAAEPLDSISFQALVPGSKVNFDKQNILEGDLSEKRQIYKDYLNRIQGDKEEKFKNSLDKETPENFSRLVSRYYMLRRANLFYAKALLLSSLSSEEVQDNNALTLRINDELKEFETLAKTTDSDFRQYRAVHEAIKTKQWRGKFGESTLAQISDPSTTLKQTRPGNNRVHALNGTQLSLLRVRKYQLIDKYKKMRDEQQKTFDNFEMWRKGFGSLSYSKLSSPTFVALQQQFLDQSDDLIPAFARDDKSSLSSLSYNQDPNPKGDDASSDVTSASNVNDLF